jgi:hypothetical protein
MTTAVLPFGIEGDGDGDRYADQYWAIGLPDGRELYLMADRIEITEGVLLAWGDTMRGGFPEADLRTRDTPHSLASAIRSQLAREENT